MTVQQPPHRYRRLRQETLPHAEATGGLNTGVLFIGLAAAVGARPWDSVASEIKATVGARYCSIWPTPLPRFESPIAISSPDLLHCIADLIRENWHLRCPRNRVVYELVSTRWTEAIVTDEHVRAVDNESLVDFSTQYLRPRGLGDFAACRIEDGNESGGLLVLDRAANDGPFGTSDIERFTTIADALRLAFAVARLTASGGRDAVLDRGPNRMIILDRHGRVVVSSSGAEETFSDDFFVRDGYLSSRDERTRRSLAALSSTDRDDAVAICRNGDSPLLLSCTPLDTAFPQLPGANALRIVFVSPIGDGYLDGRLPDLLMQLGLTRAEARVAAMVGNGASPIEAASHLSLSESTVRSYLKIAYSKLGIDRQYKLQSLVGNVSQIADRLTRIARAHGRALTGSL